MINITFPDGNVRQYEKGISAMEIAQSISEGLARNVLSATVNGEVWDASRPIENDAVVKLNTWNDDDGKFAFWHSSAHLMAEALEAFIRVSSLELVQLRKMDFIMMSILATIKFHPTILKKSKIK